MSIDKNDMMIVYPKDKYLLRVSYYFASTVIFTVAPQNPSNLLHLLPDLPQEQQSVQHPQNGSTPASDRHEPAARPRSSAVSINDARKSRRRPRLSRLSKQLSRLRKMWLIRRSRQKSRIGGGGSVQGSSNNNHKESHAVSGNKAHQVSFVEYCVKIRAPGESH